MDKSIIGFGAGNLAQSWHASIMTDRPAVKAAFQRCTSIRVLPKVFGFT